MKKKVGLFANPAKHSLSPLMHNTSFAQQQISAHYEAFTVLPEEFETAMYQVRDEDWLGVNLSMPYKETVLPLLDALAPSAQLIGAVNTVVNQSGKLIGYNTDGQGFLWDLAQQGVDITKCHLTILGTGGTARAIVCEAALQGCPAIFVCGRPSANYDLMAEKIALLKEQSATVIKLLPFTQATDAIAQSDVLVNATNVGMAPFEEQELFTVYTFMQPHLFVYDVIYAPAQTKLLQEAQRAGAQTANGLGMLIGQGALAYAHWTQQPMAVAEVKQQLLTAMEREG